MELLGHTFQWHAPINDPRALNGPEDKCFKDNGSAHNSALHIPLASTHLMMRLAIFKTKFTRFSVQPQGYFGGENCLTVIG